MPAERFTKKARTAKSRRQWQHVHDSALARGEDAGTAVREANGVVKQQSGKRRRKRSSRRR